MKRLTERYTKEKGAEALSRLPVFVPIPGIPGGELLSGKYAPFRQRGMPLNILFDAIRAVRGAAKTAKANITPPFVKKAGISRTLTAAAATAGGRE